MKIFVKAKPNAKEEKIEKIDNGHLTISVKEPPVKGKANEAICGILARYFKVSQSDVEIISGYNSKNKVIKISTSVRRRASNKKLGD